MHFNDRITAENVGTGIPLNIKIWLEIVWDQALNFKKKTFKPNLTSIISEHVINGLSFEGNFWHFYKNCLSLQFNLLRSTSLIQLCTLLFIKDNTFIFVIVKISWRVWSWSLETPFWKFAWIKLDFHKNSKSCKKIGLYFQLSIS